MKPVIVISALRSFTKGGVLTLTGECLEYLAKNLSNQYRIKAFVYQKELYPNLPQIEYYAFPGARKSFFKRVSKEIKPYLWLSLQDTTPRVTSKIRAVYFHNGHAGEPLHWKFMFKDFRHFLLHFLYLYVYPININKNNWVIIQQGVLARKLAKKFVIPSSKIIRFPVYIRPMQIVQSEIINSGNIFIFIYPATAFPYKNFEIIIHATKILNKKGVSGFEVIFTTDGKENRYARMLKKLNDNDNIRFKPYMPVNELQDLYKTADCLLFPSLVESWGLPLSEFMQMNKPVIAADLPYAHETTSGYAKVKFFNPHNAEELADCMLQAIEGSLIFDKNMIIPNNKFKMVYSWQQLFEKILSPNP
jgi:glycosyltransferase involved in cell wall biosynthesis